MDIFDFMTMLGGLSLFLFGMSLMGSALERRAGSRLRSLLDQMTGKPLVGFLTGLGVTAIIQSSSATTVMVVGFVNSGLMTLRQAINVIMGANVGTTVTAWLLSLGGIESSSVWLRLLKPSSFTPVLALIGIVFYMFCKDAKKKDTGTILLGFATLMFGMETMSGAVSGLSQVPRVHESVPCLPESDPRRAGRRGAHRHHPVQLRLRRHPAGALRHRRGQLRRRHPHHHGAEHRHHRHRACSPPSARIRTPAVRRSSTCCSMSSASPCC